MSTEFLSQDEVDALLKGVNGEDDQPTGEPEGQGQDFTLNWFSQFGIRQEIAPNLSVLGGAYFIHHSNGGQTSPNPGIDALGFTIGLGWQF